MHTSSSERLAPHVHLATACIRLIFSLMRVLFLFGLLLLDFDPVMVRLLQWREGEAKERDGKLESVYQW
jgi:hypothetical protein